MRGGLRPVRGEQPGEGPAQSGEAPAQGLSAPARVYLGGVYALALGAAAVTIALRPGELAAERVAAFVLLAFLSAAAQLFKVDAPNRHSYHTTPAFLLAAVLLLGPALLVPLVILALIPEWLRYRYPWYIQTFNISTYLLNVLAAWAVFQAAAPDGLGSSWWVAGATAGAALTFAVLNHLMVALVLWLARGIRPAESGVFALESLETDLALLCVGVGMATFWTVNPPLIALGIAPLFLFYRALFVPQLQEEAQRDGKTGLLTARRFLELLNQEVRRLAKSPRPTSVIMADLDLLREINNSLGHLAGDAVLRSVAAVLRGSLRRDDPVGRFGGEEFVILLRDTDARRAMQVAERLRAAVESTPVMVGGSSDPVRVTISLGVASYPDPCPDPHKLLHYADLAVYRSKINGRNRVSLASPGLDEGPSASAEGYRHILESLALALDARGAAVDGHTLRVTALALAMAREMGIQEGSQEWKDLERGCLLHDVGKMAIPSHILYKRGPLTEEEWAVVRRHPEVGWGMLRHIDTLEGAAEIVRAHHEHFDGSGYPRGLRGEEIPLGARIFAVADAFDAITSDRPYRVARSEEAAVEEILRNSGSQFDPRAVQALLRVLGRQDQPSPAKGEELALTAGNSL